MKKNTQSMNIDDKDEDFIKKWTPLCHKLTIKLLLQRDWSRLYNDCIQEAYIALLKAKSKYEAKKGNFKIYAYCLIRTAINDFLANQRYPISIKTDEYRDMKKYMVLQDDVKFGKKKKEKIRLMISVLNMVELDGFIDNII